MHRRNYFQAVGVAFLGVKSNRGNWFFAANQYNISSIFQAP